jgi:protein-disulfide isomerase
VNIDFQYGNQVGVSSTPTMYINGRALVGAQPFEMFQQIIDEELAARK